MTAPVASAIGELPSSHRLFRSTVLALLGAIVILVVAVLPAEYGVDPTGMGRLLGLTRMGEIKVALAREAAAEDAAAAAEAAAEDAAAVAPAPVSQPVGASPADTGWTHVTIIPLAPGEGKEVKLVMPRDARAQFAWTAVGGGVNFDMHGDSTDAPKSYISYRKGTGATADAGELVAAMDGHHGWFWRNRTDKSVAITLRTKGAYTELKKMY